MNRDFSEMLAALCGAGAEFLVVGAHALAAHGRPRATGELDLWVRPSKENALRVWQALTAFGAPLAGLEAPVLGRVDLIANKRAAGRPKDLADLAWLESEDARS